eukprot:753820-Hanusia_phi.AAC.5
MNWLANVKATALDAKPILDAALRSLGGRGTHFHRMLTLGYVGKKQEELSEAVARQLDWLVCGESFPLYSPREMESDESSDKASCPAGLARDRICSEDEPARIVAARRTSLRRQHPEHEQPRYPPDDKQEKERHVPAPAEGNKSSRRRRGSEVGGRRRMSDEKKGRRDFR